MHTNTLKHKTKKKNNQEHLQKGSNRKRKINKRFYLPTSKKMRNKQTKNGSNINETNYKTQEEKTNKTNSCEETKNN